MGTPGVKFQPDKITFLASIKKLKGKVVALANEYNCERITIRNFVKTDPDFIVALQECRNDYAESLCDMAENTLVYALSDNNENINAALKSAFFVLSNLGRERGYVPPSYADNKVDESINLKFNAFMDQLAFMQKIKSQSSEDLRIDDKSAISAQ